MNCQREIQNDTHLFTMVCTLGPFLGDPSEGDRGGVISKPEAQHQIKSK